MEFKRIPKYIDAPIQFLWWELQEGLIIIVLTFGSILIFRQALYGVVAGVIIAAKFAKFKEAHVKGFLSHFSYWFGILNVKKNIKSHQKLIIR